MSAGQPLVDRVMVPLGYLGLKLPTEDYNRIYEAVWRGNEEQRQALVAAILRVVARATRGPDV